MVGAITVLNWFTRKKVVLISPIRRPSPLNKPLTIPCSAMMVLPVSVTVPNLARDMSPCMQVLMVSSGCVSVAAKHEELNAPAEHDSEKLPASTAQIHLLQEPYCSRVLIFP